MPELEHPVTDIISTKEDVFFVDQNEHLISLAEQGRPGVDGAPQQVFVQPEAPTVTGGVPYLWVQIGGPSGSGQTILNIHDGVQLAAFVLTPI